MEEIKDPQYWSSEGFEDNLLRFNIGGNYEVVDLDGEVDEFNREENRKDLARDERRDNIDYARSKRYEDEEGAEVPERTKLLIQLVADGYVRLHKVIENEETGKKEHHYQVLAPWMGDTNFPILKAQGWKEVPFPSIRLTLDSPGTASVQLRPPYTDIQKYLDLGYKVVEDYVKATQSEDAEIEYENPATRKKEAQRAANERAHKKWQDPEYWKGFNEPGLGLNTPRPKK